MDMVVCLVSGCRCTVVFGEKRSRGGGGGGGGGWYVGKPGVVVIVLLFWVRKAL